MDAPYQETWQLTEKLAVYVVITLSPFQEGGDYRKMLNE